MARELAALRAVIYGRVQGVYFRAFVVERAEELGLTGWVRNLPIGAVEVMAEGGKEKLEKLVSHLKQGPAAARVDKVETRWSKYTGSHTGFHIRYNTA